MPPESDKPGKEEAAAGAASSAGIGSGDPDLTFTGPESGEGRSAGPWTIAWRRLRRNWLALFALAVFLLIVLACLLAPVWANDVAHTGPNTTHTLEKLHEGGETKEVVEVTGKSIGPQWFAAGGKFFLGADGHLGRDEMVRLLYGGRASLFIGFTAALITLILAVVLGLLAGYRGGWTDTVISRALDVIWSFPVVLLGISLGIALAVGGLSIGPIHLKSSSLWIPTLIIGVVTTPYMARPLRGEVLALREKEFIEAAVAQGASAWRIMFIELLPNLISTIIVFFTLNIANNMLLEATLSFLGAGVQPPNSSWGTMISEGFEALYSQPLLTIIPGTAILLTVLSINVFGDGLRDALDPKSKVRFEARSGATAERSELAELSGTGV
ncbi:MAG TPA: ABC transporter permease [Solirubrobacterales bacterium]|nr:ABC transporter permease [Solirubrobacterales bacterium]